MVTAHVREAAHPTPLTYARVAGALGLITAVEVGIFYVDALEDILLPAFILLSVVKFILVAMFYMHLKFDSRLFSVLFVGGLMLAAAVVLALMALFDAFVGSSSALAATDATDEGTNTGSEETTTTEFTLEIASVGDNLRFDASTLTAVTGEDVVLRFNNVATTQQHNWVLIESGAKDEIAAAGLLAGPANDWVPDDERVIAQSSLLGPGKSGEVRFTAPAAGTYQFVCTFPGHSGTMFGIFEIAAQ